MLADFRVDPFTIERMTFGKMIRYIELVAKLNKERSAS